jgi:hypothetical protein
MSVPSQFVQTVDKLGHLVAIPGERSNLPAIGNVAA